MKLFKTGLVATSIAALLLSGCATSSDSGTGSSDKKEDITLWLMGADTNDDLRKYLVDTYKEKTGGKLTIEEQGWGDALAKLTTALPDEKNTPDVVEIGNTWSPTFTSVGAFADITSEYDSLGGDSLLPSFVEIGKVDDKNYALPYYFGSRYNFYRKDVYAAAGKAVPKTLAEFNKQAAELKTDSMSGFYIGGSDWRNGISWIFANEGELAVKEGDKWVSDLSSENSVKGMKQFQELYKSSSLAPATEKDSEPWVNINDNPTTSKPEAATIIAPGWAKGSIGDPDPADPEKYIWNDDKFGAFALPGVDGGVAPVFAGGSNIAISAKSKKQENAKKLLEIIFSEEYQKMLGESGLGPANLNYADALGTDEFAQISIDAASNSKLTPAAPGWAAVENANLLEQYFGAVAEGGDVVELAKEYDEKINKLING